MPDTQTVEKIRTKSSLARMVGLSVIGISAAAVAVLSGIQHRSSSQRLPSTIDQPLVTNGEVGIALDMPDYLPNSLRYPQQIFSGRTIVVRTPEACSPDQCFFSEKTTGNKSAFDKPKERESTTEDSKTIVLEIPLETKSGNHLFHYMSHGQKKTFQVFIHGADEEKTNTSPVSALLKKFNFAPRIASASTVLANSIISSQRIISGCYWEMTLAGQPNNPNNLYHACAWSTFSRSTNGGTTWNSAYLFDIMNFPRSGLQYFGDQKIAVQPDGSFFMSSLFRQLSDGKIGGLLSHGSTSGNLSATIFQDVTCRTCFDYPKFVVRSSSMYISSAVPSTLYASSDSGSTFARQYLINDLVLRSLTMDDTGTLYAGVWNRNAGQLLRITSFNPLQYDIISLPMGPYSLATRVSTVSHRAWTYYSGPEVVADTNPDSPHRGRLYVAWAQPQSIIVDPSFEYGSYDYNIDILVRYSDDRGATWSTPVKVNDDTGSGDQTFPSITVDASGLVHVAFLDHRDHQDLSQFDVYYANSADGGDHFSANLKVNTAPALNSAGGRSVGDYLDMVVGYPDTAKVGYPCLQDIGNGTPSNACLTKVAITKTITPPTVSITSPVSGSLYNPTQTVVIAVSAADAVGVAKVELYDGTSLISSQSFGGLTDATLSYPWTFTGADEGAHTWTAKVYDTAGNTTTSAAVVLIVQLPSARGGGKQQFSP